MSSVSVFDLNAVYQQRTGAPVALPDFEGVINKFKSVVAELSAASSAQANAAQTVIDEYKRSYADLTQQHAVVIKNYNALGNKYERLAAVVSVISRRFKQVSSKLADDDDIEEVERVLIDEQINNNKKARISTSNDDNDDDGDDHDNGGGEKPKTRSRNVKFADAVGGLEARKQALAQGTVARPGWKKNSNNNKKI
jgi:hypothetical protein